MMDELQLEELSIRRTQERMDEALRRHAKSNRCRHRAYADRRFEAARHQKS